MPAHAGGDLSEMYKLCLHHKVPIAALDYPASMGARALGVSLDVLSGQPVPQRVEVSVRIVLPRSHEIASVKVEWRAVLRVVWELPVETVLSQRPAQRDAGAEWRAF